MDAYDSPDGSGATFKAGCFVICVVLCCCPAVDGPGAGLGFTAELWSCTVMGADDTVVVLSIGGLCAFAGSVAGEAAAFPLCLSAGTFKTVVLLLRMERRGMGLRNCKAN